MTRFLAILAFLFWLAPAASQQSAPDLVIRTTATPQSGAVIGQHVALYVDVLFRGDMPRPPLVSLPEAPGAQIFRFETQATTMAETIAGVSYVGQRFEFALYPRRGGDLDIPPALVTLRNRGGDVMARKSGEGLQISVTIPEGVDPSQPVVATRALTLDESWSPDPNASSFKAGDAIMRVVTRRTTDLPALAMRDIVYGAPEGVRAYAQAPEVRDRIDRGEVTGERIDRVTYVFEKPGRFELPPVAQPWWDLAESRARTARGGGATIDVADTTPVWRRTSTWAAMAAAAALLALAASMRRRLPQWRAAWLQSETKAFHDLRAACRTADAGATYRALVHWRELLPFSADARLDDMANGLETALFRGSASGEWSHARAAELLKHAADARRRLLQEKPTARTSALPPLN